MDFGEAVRQFYRNYANAEGRAQRAAYWYAVLYQLIIFAVLLTVICMAEGFDQLWGEIVAAAEANEEVIIDDDFRLGSSGVIAIFLLFIFAVVNFLPNIMLNIRRFHDLGQTGWFVLVFQILGAIPPVALFAGLFNLVWFALRGTTGPNQYGLDPLRQNNDNDIFG